MAAAIPHQDLAIQWDIAAEICFVLEIWNGESDSDGGAGRLDHTEQLVLYPAGTELGLHLCYGDPGHKHVVEPKDTKLMVDFTNALVASIKHPIAWVHMPVPREREDVGYFEPLKGLKLAPGTELYLGLVYRTDGLAGARRRLAAAKQVVTDFGHRHRMRFWHRSPLRRFPT